MRGSKAVINKSRQNGFVMILVIVAISLIAMVMYLLAGGANTMMFQSDTAELRAVERNLTASGLGWAKWNIKNQNEKTFDKTIELDVDNMNIRSSALSVTIHAPTGRRPQVRISTRVSRRRRTLKNAGEYEIEP